VFVVKPDQTAEQRTVESPRNFKELAVISKGINPGERVIIEGQLRVKSGTKVQIVKPGGITSTAATTTGSSNPQ
jgi:filamentous hemagglutinin family protein